MDKVDKYLGEASSKINKVKSKTTVEVNWNKGVLRYRKGSSQGSSPSFKKKPNEAELKKWLSSEINVDPDYIEINWVK